MRKVQGWCLTSVFEEYRRYAGRRVCSPALLLSSAIMVVSLQRILNEQFIEFFDVDLVEQPHSYW